MSTVTLLHKSIKRYSKIDRESLKLPWSTILHRVVIHPGVVRVQEACADVLKHLANGIFQERIGHNVGNAASKKGTLEMVVLLESLSGSPLNYGEPQIDPHPCIRFNSEASA